MWDAVLNRISVLEASEKICAEDFATEFPGLKRELEAFRRLKKTLALIDDNQDSFRSWAKRISSGKR